jgi:hypothetical protein
MARLRFDRAVLNVHEYEPTNRQAHNMFMLRSGQDKAAGELAGNQPDLARDFDRCLRAREEDVNTTLS